MESATTPRLAWKWILEKLVDLPDFGVAFFNEVITGHVKDIEEPHCRPLLERVALRNLEEMVVTNQIDSGAIPLLKALTGQDLGGPGTSSTGSSHVKQKFNKELVLRVQTEVVLSVLRKDEDEGEKDWAFYEAELERVFGDAEEDNHMLDRKRELSALLKSKNQTKANVAAYFDRFQLKKLRDDLTSFIEEKRESFSIMFLDQLSGDFLDANGTPFSEDVEKSTEVEADGKLDHVGQNPKVNETGDQHIVLGTAIRSGMKRLRRKLLTTQDDIGDDELEEAEEVSARMKKPRSVPATSIVDPLLRHGVSELAVPASGPQSGCLPVKQGIGSCNQLALLNGGEVPVSGPRNSGPQVMRNCSPAAHESISMKGAKISAGEPSRTKKYVVISDVDSDADTQIVKRLSTDDEDSVKMKGDGDKHIKKGAQSLSENGSDRGHPQNIVETEVVRKEAIVVQSEQKILVDRKEASTSSPEVKVSQQEDTEKFVTKSESIPLDSQDIYEVDFLEVGNDGHEEACHVCGQYGELLCCDGCPIAMHFDCIKGLGLNWPLDDDDDGDWYCPVCMSLMAAQEAAEAEKAAVAAKEKLKVFKIVSKRRQSSPEGDALHHNRQKKGVNQSRPRVSSMQSRENDRSLKPKQPSDDGPKLRHTEGQQDSDPSKASLLPNVLREALHQLNQQDSDHSSPVGQGKNASNVGITLRVNEQLVDASPKLLVTNEAGSIRDGSAKPASCNEDVKRIPHKPQPSQEVSRKDPLAASSSGQVRRESERLARFAKKKEPEVESDEENAEQAGAGIPEPGSHAGGRRVVEGDRSDEDLDEDRSEDRNQGKAMFSGRERIPGLRRKHLPWTRKEELALKEGVRKFSHNGAWGFQWKRILEFGRGIFDPTRTYVDLKDKWRNLVKGVS